MITLTDNANIVLRYLGYAIMIVVIWQVLYAKMYLKRYYKWKQYLILAYTALLILLVAGILGYFLYIDIKFKLEM